MKIVKITFVVFCAGCLVYYLGIHSVKDIILAISSIPFWVYMLKLASA